MRFFPFLFIVSLLAGCFSADKIDFERIEKLKIQRSGLLNILITGDAVLQNNNSMGVTIEKIASDIFIDDRSVGYMNQNVSVRMDKNASFKLPLEFKVPITKVIENAEGLLNNFKANKKFDVRLKGTITVNVLGKPVDVSFEESDELKL